MTTPTKYRREVEEALDLYPHLTHYSTDDVRNLITLGIRLGLEGAAAKLDKMDYRGSLREVRSIDPLSLLEEPGV